MNRWQHNEQITIAVAFDQHSYGLVAAGAALARRLRKSLCLLHVVEPWLEASHSLPLGATDPLWNAAQAVTTSAHQLARTRLEELAAQLPPEINVRTVVLSGKPAQTLAHEAVRLGSALLIVGRGHQKPGAKFHFGGSTALSLLASAPLPVAIVDTAKTPTLLSERPRIMLADDLGAASVGAADFALTLATLLGGGELQHVHVSGVRLEVLEATLTTALAASHTPSDSPSAAASIFEQLRRDLYHRLQVRAASRLPALKDADCRYTPEVLVGDVAEQLGNAVDLLAPDVVIFGRHKFLHTEPFFLGRVPFKAMLSLGCALIVVPNT